MEDRRRILALDVGRKRIGLAISDPLRLTAQGLETLQRKGLSQDLARLGQIAKERKVSRFLIGLPLQLSGSDSEMTALVRRFSSQLEASTGIPVQLQDERYTSVEAESRLREQGHSNLERFLKAKREGAVDRMAAIVMLEEYLRTNQSPE